MVHPVRVPPRLGEVEQGDLGRLRDPIREEDGDDHHLLLGSRQLDALQVLGRRPVATCPHQFRRSHENLRRSFHRQIRARALDVQVAKLFPGLIQRILVHHLRLVLVRRSHHVLIPLGRAQVLAVHRGVDAYHESLGGRGDGRGVLGRDHVFPRRDHTHRLPRRVRPRAPRHFLRRAGSDRALHPRFRLGQDRLIVEIQQPVHVLGSERILDEEWGPRVHRPRVNEPRLPLAKVVAVPALRLLLVVVRGGLRLLEIRVRVPVTLVERAADRGDEGSRRVLLHPILPESNVRVLPGHVIVPLVDQAALPIVPYARRVPSHGSRITGGIHHEGEGVVVPDTDIPAHRFLDREQRSLINRHALLAHGIQGCVIVGSKIGPVLLLYQAGYVVYYARVVIERLGPVKITAGYVRGYRVLGGIMILADQGAELVRYAVQFVLKGVQLVVYLQYSLHPLLDPRLWPRPYAGNVFLGDGWEVEGSDRWMGILGYAYQIVVPVRSRRARQIEPFARFVQESLVLALFALLAVLAQVSVL